MRACMHTHVSTYIHPNNHTFARIHTYKYTNTHLSSGLVVRAHHQLHTVWLEPVVHKKLDDVQLVGIKRQALDFDHAVRLAIPKSIPLSRHL